MLRAAAAIAAAVVAVALLGSLSTDIALTVLVRPFSAAAAWPSFRTPRGWPSPPPSTLVIVARN